MLYAPDMVELFFGDGERLPAAGRDAQNISRRAAGCFGQSGDLVVHSREDRSQLRKHLQRVLHQVLAMALALALTLSAGACFNGCHVC